jgi:hypothetical protein
LVSFYINTPLWYWSCVSFVIFVLYQIFTLRGTFVTFCMIRDWCKIGIQEVERSKFWRDDLETILLPLLGCHHKLFLQDTLFKGMCTSLNKLLFPHKIK